MQPGVGTFNTIAGCGEQPTPQKVTLPKPLIELVRYQSEQLQKIAELICEMDAVAAVPEWWQIRAGQRPQLIVQFAEILKTGKKGSSRWTLTIPHYNRDKNHKPKIPSYTRGNIEAILTLKDNSKVFVNAQTTTEAKRVINAIKQYIKAEYLKGASLKVGERTGNYKKIRVSPVLCKFFSNGQERMQPDWKLRLRD